MLRPALNVWLPVIFVTLSDHRNTKSFHEPGIRGVVDRREALERDVRNLVRIELGPREQIRIVDADRALRGIQERVGTARAVVAVALPEVLRRARRSPRERELVDERRESVLVSVAAIVRPG